MGFNSTIANYAWLASAASKYSAWRYAAKNPQQAQEDVLFRILKNNADTAFGHEHSFASIRHVEDFRERIPRRTYDEMLPYIERLERGEHNVLTSEEVRRFALTSGSSGGNKLIPYTKSLVSEFSSGINAWYFKMMTENPSLLKGKSYWSVTPIGQGTLRSVSGIPIGFDDERMYFSALEQWVLRHTQVAPPELALIRDMDTFRYATLRLLLQEEDLTWVSVWNPTFLKLLLAPLENYWERLQRDILFGDLTTQFCIHEAIRARLRASPARYHDLKRLRGAYGAFGKAEGPAFFRRVWPQLDLISCWAHGAAAGSVPELREMFPYARIAPKGLLATEAFVSFPYDGEASALSLNSHFFEFESHGGESVWLAHELEVGRTYNVVVTTSGGLYRYRLGDTIEVLRLEDQCPLIRFVGRSDKVVDISGEKLNEQFVCTCVEAAFLNHKVEPAFWFVAPDRTEDRGYTLFVQQKDGKGPLGRTLAKSIDEALCRNYHYRYSRQLGQLRACRIFEIAPMTDARGRYVSHCTKLGQRLGDIKETRLHSYDQWSTCFVGAYR